MNKKNILTTMLAGLVITAGPGLQISAVAQSAAGAVRIDDDQIQDRIEASLERNTILAPRNIDVDVDKGVVTLTGTVRTADEKAMAARVAGEAAGVRVRNRIDIDPKVDESKIDRAAEKTKSGLSKAVDATVGAARKSKEAVEKGLGKAEEGVAKAADKTAEGVGKVAEKASDAAISTAVRTSFADESLLKDSAIDVDTRDQVVTLKGTVPSIAAKARAEELARRSNNVSGVVNALVVRD
jgi:osmotically-inducible protein OsmY